MPHLDVEASPGTVLRRRLQRDHIALAERQGTRDQQPVDVRLQLGLGTG